MKGKKISIGVGSVEEATSEVIEAWHRAERGETPLEPTAKVLFTDLETLLRILTPRRFELLKQLRQTGPTSIRALSKALGRDYKNVHADVAELVQIGLIERTDEGLVQVPWDEIDAHLRLAA
jgi:predicted transcriptional regulator